MAQFLQKIFVNFTKKKLLKYTMLYFAGLVPDLCYCYDDNHKEVLAPMGSYSSRIIFYAFNLRKTEQECLQMFSPRFYEKMGYYDAWELSAKELRTREKNIDVTFCSEIEQYSKERYSFYTFNHPHNIILVEYAKKICKYLGLEANLFPAESYKPALDLWRWPIYQEFAEYNGIFYRTPMRFFGKDVKREISLQEFINFTYRTYENNENTNRHKVSWANVEKIAN